MIPTWVILTPLGAIGLYLLARARLRARRDRKWAASTARRVHDAEQRRTEVAWLNALYEAPSAEETA
jgi:hypothetical protein